MHLAPAEPGSEKLPSVVSKEGCTGYLIPAIVWGHHGAPGSQRVSASHFPATSQGPPGLTNKGETVSMWPSIKETRTGLVQSLRPERRKKALEEFPLGAGGGGGGGMQAPPKLT